MANYTTLRQGNGNTEENKKLQEALKNAGYGSYLGSAGVDGIYGPGTTAAVKAYQTDNKLQIDGIAGNETLGHLYSSAANTGSQQTTQQTQQVAAAVPDYSAYQYDPSGNEEYNYANSMKEEAYKGTVLPTYDADGVLQAAYDKLVNRDKFSYDLNGDALYQQYKDQYTTQGKLAMMDAMGQAAALTGGYGSSYAQSAGQQAYQGYLQKLNEVVPELYGMAYDQYQQEGQDLLNQYAMLKEMEEAKYNTGMDAYEDAWQKTNYWDGQASDAYNKGAENYYNAIQLGTAADETAYSRKQTEYSNLVNKIASTGYVPSAEERAAAGMSDGEVESWVKYYNDSVAASSSSSKEKTGITQEEMLELEGKAAEWAENGEAYLDQMLMLWVNKYGLDADFALSLLNYYFPPKKESQVEPNGNNYTGGMKM